ncbi:phospholipase [Streptomyces sp. XD-27]|uniref:phospholipase n=1 Tax=Streptomyces sp. XD-27 TaxID=3062779 RepID=UPI0026F41A4C|nr:phospholipase [Streptomyces sp. XD-27]WKX72259.1 phospholipase [Streptomyces sp. XD-27]
MSLAGAALTGAVAISLATPALAETADADRAATTATTTVSAEAAAGQSATRAYSREQKLKRLKHLTSASQDAGGDYAVDRENWRLHNRNPYGFNWKNDGCTGVSDDPGGFHFGFACARHDFGYRNYKKLNAFSRANKKHVDNTFLYDMNWTCDHQWGPYTQTQRKLCRKTAKKYYDAVVALGHL